jgi:D-xylose reductase
MATSLCSLLDGERHMKLNLDGGGKMPAIGLGLWKIPQDHTAETVFQAIKMGYRHLDAASDYGNEAQVGQGIRSALADGLCKRDELWVTSKLWNTYHRPEHVRPAIERTLKDLQLDYLDLYLIHFPISLAYVPFELRYPPGWFYDPDAETPQMKPDPCPIRETWEAMEEVKRAGLAKNIGVSNFNCSLIRDLLSYANIRPSVLQVESHPYLVQPKLLRYCQQERIAFTAFSPLGAGSYVPLGMATDTDSVLNQPIVQSIGRSHHRTPAQVVLRWGVQRGTAIVPKSSRIERLRENLAIFDFELTSSEMDSISALDCNRRFNDPGVFCESAFGCFYPIYE